MKTQKIENALKEFAGLLAETPKWLLLFNYRQELLAAHIIDTSEVDWLLKKNRPGDFAAQVIRETRRSVLPTMRMLDKLEFGTYQYSLHFGSKGIYVVMRLHGFFVLAISYGTVGMKSLDNVVGTMMIHFQIIIDAAIPD